jgi:hypothetical protein
MPTTTADQPTPQGPSLEEAALRIEGLLDLQETEGNPEPSADADDAAHTDGEGVAADAKTKETPAPEETQEVEAEASEETESTETADEAPGEITIEVKVDGKTKSISAEEAANGYQRYADYTRKTEQLAAERKEFEDHAKAVQEERQTYATMLVALRDQLQELQPEEPDWAEVYRTDPVGYPRRRDEWRDKQDKIAAAKFELERIQSVERKEQEANLAKLQAEKKAEMFEMVPEWKNPTVWEADRQKILKYAREVCKYSDKEIANAYDPRAIVYMNKARLWDELQANKPKPAAVKRPGVAPAGASRDTTSNKLNAAQQRLAKSGRIEDAAKVFEQII